MQQVQETMNNKMVNVTASLYLERLLDSAHALCLASVCGEALTVHGETLRVFFS